MEIYRSEEEQVEALKRWWTENGRSVILGVVIALALVFGWRTWLEYRQTQAEAASLAYQQLIAEVEGGAGEAARSRGGEIVANYPQTIYAPLASLMLGKLALDGGDLPAAEAHLRWAMANADLEEIRQVARLRLARVQHEQGKSQEALTLLQEVPAGSFAAPFAEARGDILLAQGERAKAREAYEQALAGYAGVPQKQALLRMKIDDLADVAGAKQGS